MIIFWILQLNLRSRPFWFSNNWFSSKLSEEKRSWFSNRTAGLDPLPDSPFTLMPIGPATRLPGDNSGF